MSEELPAGPSATEAQPVLPVQPAPASVFGTRVPSTVVFAIGFLVFFLPFLEIHCNGMAFAKFSGAQLATGYKLEVPGSDNTITGRLQRASDDKHTSDRGGNPYALGAFVLSAVALALALTGRKAGVTTAAITGILAAVGLIGLLIDVKGQVSAELRQTDEFLITVDFSPWFYISLISAISGAVLCIRRLAYLKS